MKNQQQDTLMKFDPATREERPYPSHARQWRKWHGETTAWLFCPWTGKRRDARDVGGDVQGILIIPPGEPIYAFAKGAGVLGDAEFALPNADFSGARSASVASDG